MADCGRVKSVSTFHAMQHLIALHKAGIIKKSKWYIYQCEECGGNIYHVSPKYYHGSVALFDPLKIK